MKNKIAWKSSLHKNLTEMTVDKQWLSEVRLKWCVKNLSD